MSTHEKFLVIDENRVISTVYGNQGTGSLFSAEILDSLLQSDKKSNKNKEEEKEEICQCGRKFRNGDCPPGCPQH